MGISERKQREKQQRNTQILDAARALFVDKGFGATTMQDIADRAELGRRTLYLYFKTKDEIVNSIAQDIIRELSRLVREASARRGNGRERMDSVAESFVQYYKSRPADFLLILNTDFNESRGTQAGGGRQRVDDFIHSLTELLTDILDAGLEDGTLRSSGAPTSLTARTMIISILGTLKTLALYPVEEREREAQLVLLIKMITNSVIPPQAD
jgi:AcrR family transcriptional regulator